MIEIAFNNLLKTIRKFTNNTIRNNDSSSKRTINYLKWCKLKTEIIEDIILLLL